MLGRNTKRGTGRTVGVSVLALGLFAGAAFIINDQAGLIAVSFAKDGESGGNSGSGSGGGQDDGSSSSGSDADRNAEKDAQKRQEDARKRLERSNRSSNANSSDDLVNGVKLRGDGSVDDNQDGIGGDDTNTVEDDNDNNGMFKDRAKTLSKLQEEIARAEEDIAEQQADGVDVTLALARLALAKTDLTQVGTLFDANDLDAAKALAKQIRKIAHFAEKDLQNAEKITDAVAKIDKRFGQADRKMAVLEDLGGDTADFEAQLATLRSDFSALKDSIVATPDTITRDTVRAFERRVKQLKNAIESAIFALGGTSDDDLIGDHREDEDDLSEDLNDVAEIEDGDDNGVSGRLRRISAEHQLASQDVEESLGDIRERNGFLRTLFGPDFNALDSLTAQIAAMNTRADALDAAALQITDLQVKQILVDQAAALRSGAAKLQAYIASEDNRFSIFGKFLSLFRS